MKKISLFCITFILAFSVNAQKYSRNDVVKDIDAMVLLLKDIHPNMFAEYAESNFYEEIEKAKAQITDSMDVFGVYKVIEPLTVLLGDGHTQLSFPRNHFTGDEPFFPLSIIVDSNDSTIITNHTYTTEDVSIPSGATILSINGTPYKEIIEDMLRYHSGERIFFRLAKTSMNFSDILFILYPSETFDIEYSYNGEVQKETLNAIPRKDVRNIFLMTLFAPPPYSYTIEKEVAILTIKSLSGRKQFRQMVEKMFDELKELTVRNLIIDLRNNGGGDSSLGDTLITYLVDRPFAQFWKVEVKISETTKSMSMGAIADSVGIVTADTTNLITFLNPKPEQERYKGNVYVLTNHTTFSSASSLASLLKEYDAAKIVGEETGGMSVSYGNIVHRKLPMSGITLAVSFARMHLMGSDENDIHGVVPDFPVRSDDALDKALELIAVE